MGTMQKIDKLIIADEFLETAIEHYLSGENYFSALHLAGAAQEIFGRWLRINQKQDYSTSILDQNEKFFNEHGFSIDRKEGKRVEKHPKNTIKHINNKEDQFAQLKPELDACLEICCAIEDYSSLGREETESIKTFKKHFVGMMKNAHL